jgi:hypothetical protein
VIKMPVRLKLMNRSLEKLKQDFMQSKDADIEMVHSIADEVLCDLLLELGYELVVEEYKKVPKWYA